MSYPEPYGHPPPPPAARCVSVEWHAGFLQLQSLLAAETATVVAIATREVSNGPYHLHGRQTFAAQVTDQFAHDQFNWRVIYLADRKCFLCVQESALEAWLSVRPS